MKNLYGIMVVLAMIMAGCSKQEQIGGPYMLVEIHGTVMDPDGNALQGIEVSAGQNSVVRTNVNGNFTFHGRLTPMTNPILTFEDKDGDRNGGEFIKKEEPIEVNEKIPADEKGNFKGKFFAQSVEIIMLPKNSQINPGDGGLDTDPDLTPASAQ